VATFAPAAPVATSEIAAADTAAPLATLPAATPGATQTTRVISHILSVVVDGTPMLLGPGTPPPTPRAWWEQTNDVSPEQVAELSAAYDHFWSVRAQALLDLDDSSLREVAAGPLLQSDEAMLDGLRAQNQADQVDLEHHIQVRHATDTDATIEDDLAGYTVAGDMDTGQTLTPTPASTSQVAYHLQKLSGTWKVVEAVQLTQ